MKPIDRHLHNTLPTVFLIAIKRGEARDNAMLEAIATAVSGIAIDDPATALRMAINACSSTPGSEWERTVNRLVSETIEAILGEKLTR